MQKTPKIPQVCFKSDAIFLLNPLCLVKWLFMKSIRLIVPKWNLLHIIKSFYFAIKNEENWIPAIELYNYITFTCIMLKITFIAIYSYDFKLYLLWLNLKSQRFFKQFQSKKFKEFMMVISILIASFTFMAHM